MRRSTSKSSTTPGAPERHALRSTETGALLSVDVEEWFHNCWVPEYVDPSRRPGLVTELERLLPALVDLLSRTGARATFFVLGEVAQRLAPQLRAARALGHEIACHGDLHLRANDRSPDAFRADIVRARDRVEQAIGERVAGFRAPEWSLRDASNPRLRLVAEAGFLYDSSLSPAPGAGGSANPTGVTRFRWRDGAELVELPPLTWAGRWRLPAAGWTGRVLPAAFVAAAVGRAADRGSRPLLVVHPWELVDRGCPGTFTGLARLFHDAGRRGYRERFEELLRRVPCRQTLAEAVAGARTADGAGVAARNDLDETWAAPPEVA